MKTIALRFADNIAPKDGTIAEHEKIIERYGFVWYGKFGARVSEKPELMYCLLMISVYCSSIVGRRNGIGST